MTTTIVEPKSYLDVLDELVRRIRSVADPCRIVLFGSRARGGHRADSDFDILIVAESPLRRYHRSVPIYAALADLPLDVDVDVVVYTPAEVEEWHNASAAFVTTALREGKVLYER